jgi:hypothetical protein
MLQTLKLNRKSKNEEKQSLVGLTPDVDNNHPYYPHLSCIVVKVILMILLAAVVQIWLLMMLLRLSLLLLLLLLLLCVRSVSVLRGSGVGQWTVDGEVCVVSALREASCSFFVKRIKFSIFIKKVKIF